eukprot:m.140652 g.140652  ORF g.140652 m.140652 type:complete len:354 (+) comp13184_c2_seq6:240-1301(+)
MTPLVLVLLLPCVLLVGLTTTSRVVNAQFPSMFGRRGMMMDPFHSNFFPSRRSPFQRHPQHFQQPQRRRAETMEERQLREKRENELATQKRVEQLKRYEKQLEFEIERLQQLEGDNSDKLAYARQVLTDHDMKGKELQEHHDISRQRLLQHEYQKRRINNYIDEHQRKRDYASQEKTRYASKLAEVQQTLYGSRKGSVEENKVQHEKQQQEKQQEQRLRILEERKQQEQLAKAERMQHQYEQQQREQQRLMERKGEATESIRSQSPFLRRVRVQKGDQEQQRFQQEQKRRQQLGYEIDEDGNKWQAGGIWVGLPSELAQQLDNNNDMLSDSIEDMDAIHDDDMIAEIDAYLNR